MTLRRGGGKPCDTRAKKKIPIRGLLVAMGPPPRPIGGMEKPLSNAPRATERTVCQLAQARLQSQAARRWSCGEMGSLVRPVRTNCHLHGIVTHRTVINLHEASFVLLRMPR